MHERADRLAGNFVTVDDDLAGEFETRLVESSTLAFRVAFSVLASVGQAGSAGGKANSGSSPLLSTREASTSKAPRHLLNHPS